MSRAKPVCVTRYCAHKECRESAQYRYDSRTEYNRARKENTLPDQRWLCARHRKPEEVLTLENLKLVYETEPSSGGYWRNRGLVLGPGFKAWAKDFPEGTKLKVTAEVILP